MTSFLPSRSLAPVTVRMARSLIWAQAALALLAAAFALVLSAVGPSDATASQPRGVLVAYSLAVTLALFMIGRYLGRLVRPAYYLAILAEAVLAALFAVSLGTATASGAVGLLVSIVALVLLWTPSARAAFNGATPAAIEAAAGGAPTE